MHFAALNFKPPRPGYEIPEGLRFVFKRVLKAGVPKYITGR